MLWDIDKLREISRIPHEVAVAGWIPDPTWPGNPFQSIYEDACDRDFEVSRLLFSILAWVTLMEHEEFWGFMRDVVVHDAPVGCAGPGR